MLLFKSFIQDLDTDIIKVNFTGSNLNIHKAMKRKLIQVTNSHELDQLINNTAFLSVAFIFV